MENYVGLDIILNDSQVKEQMNMEILKYFHWDDRKSTT